MWTIVGDRVISGGTVTTDEQPAPETAEGVDVDRPSAARIYDWMLGGTTNWALDREFGRRQLGTLPLMPCLFLANRRWMNRVVREAVEAGVSQFLDLGAGIPTRPDPAKPAGEQPPANVHDLVAARLGDAGRVVYVDNESVAAAHARIVLEDQGHRKWAGVAQADLRDPRSVMADEVVRSTLDLDRPVCVLLASVLHFVLPADRPDEVVAGYRAHLAPGSWVAISHATSTVPDDPELARQLRRVAEAYENTQNPGYLRDREEVEALFAGTELLEPGLVHLPDWRPEPLVSGIAQRKDAAVRGAYWCGVGRVR